jgi:hypothetical protein
MRRLTRSLIVALLLAAMPVGTVTAVTPSPTAATNDAALTRLKTKGTAEIDRRQKHLEAALQKIESSTQIKTEDKAALTKLIKDQIAGLVALKAKLAGETTVAAARVSVASIVTDYRVYALTLSKARMVASADRFAVAQEKLQALHNKLAPKVGDDATLKAKLQHMQEQITASATASTGVVPKLLALQPTDYNANHAVLVQYRASLKTAHDALKSAREDAKFIIDELKPHTH